VSSSWIIGATELAAAGSITVSGTPVAVPLGAYYLRDPAPSLSLIDVVLAAVAPEMTAPSIFVGRDRKIRITDSAPFTWTAISVNLQAALGLGPTTGPATTSYTAPSISVLLWSPGWCATTIGHPTHTSGFRRPTRVHTSSPSGLTQKTTVHGTAQRRAQLRWAQVLRSRGWAEDEDDGAPGDFQRFVIEVLEPGHRWKWYGEVAEAADNVVDATPAAWPAPRGPYKTETLPEDWWARSVPNTDTHTDAGLDGLLTAEIGA
jgi:hypothetical protein